MATVINEIGEVDPETSILFLGSGFSLGATNIARGNPPNGSELRRHFIKLLKLPLDTTYDLQVLTEEFAENDAKKLHAELYRSTCLSGCPISFPTARSSTCMGASGS